MNVGTSSLVRPAEILYPNKIYVVPALSQSLVGPRILDLQASKASKRERNIVICESLFVAGNCQNKFDIYFKRLAVVSKPPYSPNQDGGVPPMLGQITRVSAAQSHFWPIDKRVSNIIFAFSHTRVIILVTEDPPPKICPCGSSLRRQSTYVEPC